MELLFILSPVDWAAAHASPPRPQPPVNAGVQQLLLILSGSNPKAMGQPAGRLPAWVYPLAAVSRLQTQVLAGAGGLAKTRAEIMFKTTVKADLSENIPFLEPSQLSLLESPWPLPSCVYLTHAKGRGGCNVCVFTSFKFCLCFVLSMCCRLWGRGCSEGLCHSKGHWGQLRLSLQAENFWL